MMKCLQPTAYSLQPTAYSLQPTAFKSQAALGAPDPTNTYRVQDSLAPTSTSNGVKYPPPPPPPPTSPNHLTLIIPCSPIRDTARRPVEAIVYDLIIAFITRVNKGQFPVILYQFIEFLLHDPADSLEDMSSKCSGVIVNSYTNQVSFVITMAYDSI